MDQSSDFASWPVVPYLLDVQPKVLDHHRDAAKGWGSTCSKAWYAVRCAA